jgi:drug/metabolite transporter (DMT)-like permease
MLLASALFAAMGACVKALGPTFPFVEAVFFRALFGIPLLMGGMRFWSIGWRPVRPWLIVLRGAFGLVAMLSYFYAVQRGLLANIMVIHRLQPVLVALLAPLLLRESAPRAVLLALALGFAGVLFVAQPTSAAFDLPALAALGSAAFSAVAHLSVRRLSASDHPLRIVLFFSLITAAGAGLLSLPLFVWPAPTQWALLAGTAACATGGQLLLTTAYGRDRAPVVAAVSYSAVLYALLLGWLFWGEWPDAAALTGGALIVVAGMVLLRSRASVDVLDRSSP